MNVDYRTILVALLGAVATRVAHSLADEVDVFIAKQGLANEASSPKQAE